MFLLIYHVLSNIKRLFKQLISQSSMVKTNFRCQNHLHTGGLQIKRIYFASITILTKYLNGYDENYVQNVLTMFLVVGVITSPLSNLLLHARDYIHPVILDQQKL